MTRSYIKKLAQIGANEKESFRHVHSKCHSLQIRKQWSFGWKSHLICSVELARARPLPPWVGRPLNPCRMIYYLGQNHPLPNPVGPLVRHVSLCSGVPLLNHHHTLSRSMIEILWYLEGSKTPCQHQTLTRSLKNGRQFKDSMLNKDLVDGNGLALR